MPRPCPKPPGESTLPIFHPLPARAPAQIFGGSSRQSNPSRRSNNDTVAPLRGGSVRSAHSDSGGKLGSGRQEHSNTPKAGSMSAAAANRLANAQVPPSVSRSVSVGGTIRFRSDVQTVAPPITKLFAQSTGSSRSFQDIYDTSASWELGRGGCGAVYTVRHRRTLEEFAMKSVSISGLDEAAVNELRNEIEIQSRLDHPNIVKLIEWFEDVEREAIHIILELCLGGSLVHRMRRHRRAPFGCCAGLF